MANRPPGNAQVLSRSKFRRFDGIGGPVTQILKRTNERGNDISNTLSNNIEDMQLTERGSMKLRPGYRKITTTGYTDSIHTLLDIKIGYVPRFGVHHGTQLDIIDRPQWGDGFSGDPVFLSPLNPATALSDERVSVFPGDPV